MAATTLIAVTTARADSYVEVVDAGQTPSTAQPVDTLTPGGGSLDSIVGSLTTTEDSDVYRIYIESPSIFSASIETVDPNADTQIYLFHENGAGIAFNDDTPGGSDFNASLPPFNSLYASLPAGIYLLGIAAFDNDPYIVEPPVEESDYVFPFNFDAASELVSGPNASAVGVPFINFETIWAEPPPVGAYTVHLTGVTIIPEPSALALLGLGALTALRRGRA